MSAALTWTAAGIAGLMLATWLLSLRLRDVSIVDVVWGLGLVMAGWIALAAGDGEGPRPWLAVALVSVWGLRLAGHIALRKRREPGEDPRYARWREKRPETFWLYSLGAVFALQAALQWVVALPLIGAATGEGGLGVLDALGVALWAAGLSFEAVGDAQLARFKADPANRGTVMDRGLWRYTRHPNYFGDACVWWGLYLLALSAGAWWALPGPLVMTVLLTRVSGKDHLERTLAQRPGYAAYVRRTSGFVPLPPRGAGR